ncbi:MAG TPA: hypothetical protein VEM57_04970, partial [Candidatus Binatus sp.]|nr:hypothetical protein [Candidatus Binatus sp.]
MQAYGSFDRRQAVSINDAGEIAFVAAFETAIPGTPFLTRDIGVFLHDRTSGVTRLVTRTRDLVGTELLVNIDDRYVGVNSAGDVAFLGTVQSGRKLVLASGGVLRPLTADVPDGSDLAPRLTDTDQVIWSADGTVGHLDGDVRRVAGPSRAIPVGPGFSAIHASINQAGVGVFSAVREALYLLGARRPRLIAREGDSITGAGTIASLGAVAVSDEAIVVSARDESGTPIVAKLTGGRLTKLLAAGDPAPGGGTVSLEDQRVSLRGERVLVASGFNDPQGVTALLEVNARSGALAEVIRVGGPGPDGAVLKALVDWTFLGSGVVFAAFLEGDRSGIFARRGARMFALRLGGDPAPGGGIFDSFWSVAASGQRVVFGASLRDETFRIVLGRRGNLRNVVQTGDEVRVAARSRRSGRSGSTARRSSSRRS